MSSEQADVSLTFSAVSGRENTLCVAVIRIERPAQRNALRRATVDAIINACAIIRHKCSPAAEQEPDVPVVASLNVVECQESMLSCRVASVILTGSGNSFCAGADLLDASGDGSTAPLVGVERGQETGDNMATFWNPLLMNLYTLPVPLVTAINGVAAGGGVGLALVSDICVASEAATFVCVFAPRLGLVPDLGASWFLPRLLGRRNAMAFALLGEKMTAEQALKVGLVYEVVPDPDILPRAMDVASRLAKTPTHAAIGVRFLLDRSHSNTFSQQLEYERAFQTVAASSINVSEGVMAFAAKSEPEFSPDLLSAWRISKL